MTLPQAEEILGYWRNSPPEHEMLAMFARVYTTWEPADAKPMTPEEHRKSLEDRWKAGAMNPAQLFKAMGGNIIRSPADLKKMPGIGPFPGTY